MAVGKFKNNSLYIQGGLLNYYGVERPRNVDDPVFFTIIGSQNLHNTLPIHNQIQLCKVNENRQVVNYLSKTDITKNADGTAAVLDGSDGLDVLNYYPDMYLIMGGSDPVYERYIVGSKPFSYEGDVAVKYDAFVDAPDYCTIDRTTNKSRCIKNETANFAGSGELATAGGLGYPRTSLTRYNYETYAEAKGLGWTAWQYYDYVVQAALMYIEYKTKNLKSVFGNLAYNWTDAQWNGYNGYNPVIKTLEVHTGLSNTAGVNSKGYLTGVYTKTINSIATPFGLYRGKILWGHLWKWLSNIDEETQAAGSGGKSNLYISLDPTKRDPIKSDADFNFKSYNTFMGELPRTTDWAKEVLNGTIHGKTLGAAETTGACGYNWHRIPASGVSRYGVRFGARLLLGGQCALASMTAYNEPSFVRTDIGGGFRANVNKS